MLALGGEIGRKRLFMYSRIQHVVCPYFLQVLKANFSSSVNTSTLIQVYRVCLIPVAGPIRGRLESYLNFRGGHQCELKDSILNENLFLKLYGCVGKDFWDWHRTVVTYD